MLKNIFFVILITTFYVSAMLMVGREGDLVVTPRIVLLVGFATFFVAGVFVRKV